VTARTWRFRRWHDRRRSGAARRCRQLGRASARRRPAGAEADTTIADAGQGLRAGQKAAWGGTPCHGDVFHIIRQCEVLANTLSRVAKGVTSRRKKLEAQFGRAGQPGPDDALVGELALARQTETQAQWLARDIRTLTQWLSRDVLALAGPDLATCRAVAKWVLLNLRALAGLAFRRGVPID
jgi:hypothetical protein